MTVLAGLGFDAPAPSARPGKPAPTKVTRGFKLKPVWTTTQADARGRPLERVWTLPRMGPWAGHVVFDLAPGYRRGGKRYVLHVRDRQDPQVVRDTGIGFGTQRELVQWMADHPPTVTEASGKADASVPELTSDELLDFAATITDTPAKAARRDRAMERAHEKGLDACEICGRALDAQSEKATVACQTVGPTCLRKLQKAGLVPRAPRGGK